MLPDELNINKLDSLETAIGEYLKYQKRILVKYQCELLDAEKLVSARRAEVSRLNIIIDELSQILDESND